MGLVLVKNLSVVFFNVENRVEKRYPGKIASVLVEIANHHLSERVVRILHLVVHYYQQRKLLL